MKKPSRSRTLELKEDIEKQRMSEREEIRKD